MPIQTEPSKALFEKAIKEKIQEEKEQCLEREANTNLEDIYQIIDKSIKHLEADLEKIFSLKHLKNPDILMKQLYQLLSKAVEFGTEQSPEKPFRACHAGCSSCCIQQVPVTSLEALIIANEIKKSCSTTEALELKNRVAKNAKQYQDLKSINMGLKISCAFLKEDGLCRIHTKRPSRCRAFFSRSKFMCDAHKDNQTDVVPIDGFAGAWVRGTQSTLAQVLSRHNLDAHYYELHNAVHCALNTKDAFSKWLKGKPIFKNCLKAAASPKNIWLAPQADGSMVYLQNKGKKFDKEPVQVVIVKYPGE